MTFFRLHVTGLTIALLLASVVPLTAAPRVTVKASLDRTSVPLNRTATLTVRVEWQGKWGDVDIDEPSPPQSADLDIKAGGVSTEVVERHGQQVSVKLYSFELSPRRVGVADVSPVIVTYRTPTDNKPHDLQTPRLKLEVTPAVREGLSRPVRTGIGVGSAVLLLALLIAAFLRARQALREPAPDEETPTPSPADRLLAELDEHKSLRIAGDARGYCAAVAAALRAYLAAVFDLNTRDLSTARLLDALAAENADPELLANCRVVLERCDLAKFAGTAPSPAELDQLHDVVSALARLPARATPREEEAAEEDEPD